MIAKRERRMGGAVYQLHRLASLGDGGRVRRVPPRRLLTRNATTFVGVVR